MFEFHQKMASFLLLAAQTEEDTIFGAAQTRNTAWTYLQLPFQQWGTGNIYLLMFFSWKVNIAENPIAVMEL